MLRKTKPQIDELDDELTGDEPLTDEEIAQGFYSHNEMKALGIVRDRQDQRRKQLLYGFPKPVKTGDRQAPISKARVHRWIRQRAALSHTATK
jgi:predicted DNA-binding transcriptional regulator AlpA